MKKEEEMFWDREREANFTRKKPLTDLEFITVPFEKLPLNEESDNQIIADCSKALLALKDKKIVNLNGISNTDLKLKYGVSNLTILSEYDENYTTLVSELANLAEEYHNINQDEESVKVLECATECKSDVVRSYALLASIYEASQKYDEIEALIEKAASLKSPAKESIVKKLRSYSLYNPSYSENKHEKKNKRNLTNFR